jgi:solute:Na+ symporter, SSS family
LGKLVEPRHKSGVIGKGGGILNEVVVGVIGYIVIQFAIGAWVARRIVSESDYINAGHKIGPVIGAFTVFATWFGAEAVIGSAGEVYREGIDGATIDPFGYSLALVVSGLVLAAPLWRRGFVTFGDLFRERYSPGVEKLAVFLMIPGTVMWAAAQIRAFGHVMGAASDMPVFTMIAVGAVVVVAYTTIGGLMADAITDFVQGVAIILGLIVLVALVIASFGGFSSALAEVSAARLTYGAAAESPLSLLEQWAIPIFGTMVSIELISRMLAARSAAVARNACIWGGVLYLFVGVLPVFLGLVGPAIVPGLEDGEQVVPRLAEIHLPGVLYVIFAGAMVSAILSTVDSALLASGSILSHNVIQPSGGLWIRSRPLLVTRATVAGLGLVAFFIALQEGTIHELIETAASFGSAGLVVVAIFGLFTPIGSAASAYAALISGATIWGGLSMSELTETPYLAGVLGAVSAYLVFAFPNRR